MAIKFSALGSVPNEVGPDTRRWMEAVAERLSAYAGETAGGNARVVTHTEYSTSSSSSAPAAAVDLSNYVQKMETPTLHAHNIPDVYNLQHELDRIEALAGSGAPAPVDPLGTPAAHPHNIWDVMSLQGELDRLEGLISGGGAVVFTDLTDVPASYPAGSGGNHVMVNKGGTGLEFKKFVQPPPHPHNIQDVAGLQNKLDELATSGGSAPAAGPDFWGMMFQMGLR